VTTFEFSLIASGLDPEAEKFADRFFEAGCDDATISVQKGHIILDFAREAKSIEDAICSAVEGAQKAGARVDRVEPDPLVSLADIAARADLTRAAVTQYAKGQRGENFPAPVARVTSDTSLYDWTEVATWLFQHKRLSREEVIAAAAVKAANEAISAHERKLRSRMRKRMARFEKQLAAA
jgi:predicted transcriptional regulator